MNETTHPKRECFCSTTSTISHKPLYLGGTIARSHNQAQTTQNKTAQNWKWTNQAHRGRFKRRHSTCTIEEKKVASACANVSNVPGGGRRHNDHTAPMNPCHIQGRRAQRQVKPRVQAEIQRCQQVRANCQCTVHHCVWVATGNVKVIQARFGFEQAITSQQ